MARPLTISKHGEAGKKYLHVNPSKLGSRQLGREHAERLRLERECEIVAWGRTQLSEGAGGHIALDDRARGCWQSQMEPRERPEELHPEDARAEPVRAGRSGATRGRGVDGRANEDLLRSDGDEHRSTRIERLVPGMR